MNGWAFSQAVYGHGEWGYAWEVMGLKMEGILSTTEHTFQKIEDRAQSIVGGDNRKAVVPSKGSPF